MLKLKNNTNEIYALHAHEFQIDEAIEIDNNWYTTDVIQAIVNNEFVILFNDVQVEDIVKQLAYLKGDSIYNVNNPMPVNLENLPKDSDGSPIHRLRAAKAGWKAQFHSMRIVTSKTDGVRSKHRDGTDIGFASYTMKDINGDTTTVEADCVETIINWEPTHDMEIVGGQLFQKASATAEVWLWVTAAPHIPEAYGGNIAFIEGGVCLEDIESGGVVDFDGRVAKYIAYDPINHSGRFEICLKHPAGHQHKCTIVFEFFRP
jgi:hypothetical protein